MFLCVNESPEEVCMKVNSNLTHSSSSDLEESVSRSVAFNTFRSMACHITKLSSWRDKFSVSFTPMAK